MYGKEDWIYGPDCILLDSEFNSDQLGWKHGDLFKFINVNGRQVLVKVDPLVAFLESRDTDQNYEA